MSFHVFPDPTIAPLPPAGPFAAAAFGALGDTSQYQTVAELTGLAPAGGVPAEFFVRVAKQAVGGLGPDVFLRVTNTVAGTNAEGLIDPSNNGGNPAQIGDGTNAGVINAIYTPPDGNNVAEVHAFVTVANLTFEIKVRNHDGVPRTYTWVAATSQGEAQQGWIDVKPVPLPPGAAAHVDVLVNTSPAPNIAVQVANLGTGPLAITDTAGTNLTGHFTLSAVSTPINPNASANQTVTYAPPGTIGTNNIAYLLNSNDPAANIAGHNRLIQLSAITRQLEVMLSLDGSGSMAFMPNGSANVPNANLTRWGRLKSAVKEFLDVLSHLSAGQGRFGVAVFPNIRAQGCPVPSPSALDLFTANDITAANINTVVGILNSGDPTPVQGCAATPMGQGIAQVMGAGGGQFGYFLGASDAVNLNRRYMVLMSDGAQNSGPPVPPDFYGSGPASFLAKKIKAMTVAYGEETGTPFEVDHNLLRTISAQSTTVLAEKIALALDAGADDQGLALKAAFKSILVTGLTLQPTLDPGGVLTGQNPEVRPTVPITQYDTRAVFSLNWSTPNEHRLNFALITPLCEVITPEVARDNPHIFYSNRETYAVYTFDNDFLRNADDPSRPRYGVWTLIISANFDVIEGGASAELEPYSYDVITDSRLKLFAAADRTVEPVTYFTGDPIKLSARLALDLQGIPGASVTIKVKAPGQSADDWVATHTATREEMARARKFADPLESSTISIKAIALDQKGLKFDQAFRNTVLTATDPDNDGTYEATWTDTSTPGTYEFIVRGVGVTADGVSFSREKTVQVQVVERFHIDFTTFDVRYFSFEGGNLLGATVRVIPRDRFGHVRLVDTEIDDSIRLTAQGGDLVGRLTNNLDGSYSQTVRFPRGSTPQIGLVVDGAVVAKPRPLPPIDRLTFVDQVLAFLPGGEAVPGANQHTDPKAALGDILARQDDFVALGAGGSLTVGLEGKVIVAQGGRGDDDITVFVGDPGGEPVLLRSYRVDVLTGTLYDRWVTIGESKGVTQSFALPLGKVKTARAIRIVDTSQVAREADMSASPAPGAVIAAVGVRQTRAQDGEGGGTLEDCLNALRRLLCDVLTPGEG